MDEPSRRRRRKPRPDRKRKAPLPTAADKPLLRPELGPWHCYLLTSPASTVPYVGKTNNLARRLREHNGALAGGAARTHRALAGGDAWTRQLHVSGFPDERAALNLEWRWQRDCRLAAGEDRRAGRGPLERGLRALVKALSRDRPTSVALPYAAYGGVTVATETGECAALWSTLADGAAGLALRDPSRSDGDPRATAPGAADTE